MAVCLIAVKAKSTVQVGPPPLGELALSYPTSSQAASRPLLLGIMNINQTFKTQILTKF